MTPETMHDLPARLSQPALRALHQAGITRLEQLTAFREADLRKLHGMGPKALDLLRTALAERGLTFAGDEAASRGST